MKTFICKFEDGVSCEAQFPDSPPQDLSNFKPTVLWSDRPNIKFFRDYIAWMNSTIQTIVNEWKVKFRYGYIVSPGRALFWTFEPGKTPKLIIPKGKK